jgi:uncharacterized protein with PQ loop repeat
MTPLEYLYTFAVATSVFASFPQVYKLITTRRSDELSLVTWVVWLVAQLVSLAYVLSIHNILLVVVNIAWVCFYSVMLFLIIYYRYHPGRELELLPVCETDNIDD